jgi:hypothetical protein
MISAESLKVLSRVARIIVVWAAIVAVGVSAVMTCVPGVMQMQASRMPSCADMDHEQPRVALDAATNCCTHHDPSLTAAKADVQKSPIHDLSPWFVWIAPVMNVRTTLASLKAESPPDLPSALGPPTYIVLSTLRV